MRNTLIDDPSPYLQQHKNNPVHWQTWNEESLNQAKTQKKPILLSVGYSSCHWCHVMAHESFEDQKTADLMNEFFYFMIFRFAGGAGTPFAIQNLLPVLFNMKVKNYFFSTMIGLFPMVFILCAIGSGIEKIIEENIDPGFLIMIQNREILFPILGFFAILMFSFILRKIYFKK